MQQPSSAPLSSTPTTVTQAATETVTRPDPGLARGKWEAPAWAFWVALAVVVVGTTLYVLARLGIIRRRAATKNDATDRVGRKA